MFSQLTNQTTQWLGVSLDPIFLYGYCTNNLRVFWRTEQQIAFSKLALKYRPLIIRTILRETSAQFF